MASRGSSVAALTAALCVVAGASSARADGLVPWDRKVDVGPLVGLRFRSSEGGAADYKPGVEVGAQARIRVLSWLGVRPYFSWTKHAVDIRGGLGLCAGEGGAARCRGTRFQQPDFDVILLGLRIEPTYQLSRRLGLWIGPGIGWGLTEAPRLTSDATSDAGVSLVSAERSGAHLEWSLALGGRYDLVPEWLNIELMFLGAIYSSESGRLYEGPGTTGGPGLQAFDTTGQRWFLRSLPTYDYSLAGQLSLSLIL